ncbi:MAG: hypothetical protein M0T85_06400 [Dehalococcoidales bacterium]|nr:hypothetical protein [Dehalococcoidales bacterium]
MTGEQTPKEYTPTQMLFLRRLEHLLLTRKQLVGLSHVPWPGKLVSVAIYSTLLDCRELGVDDEARRIRQSYAPESQKTSR